MAGCSSACQCPTWLWAPLWNGVQLCSALRSARSPMSTLLVLHPTLLVLRRKYQVMSLKIVARRHCTGFEESKELPVHVGDVIAGRYQVGWSWDFRAEGGPLGLH